MIQHYEYGYFCQRVLPLVFDDALSYYEQLCKLLYRIINMDISLDQLQAQFTALVGRQDSLEQMFNDLRTMVTGDIEEMQALLERIKNGDYVDLYLPSIINYINDNLQQLVASIVNFVSLGLTNDGYFAAYIPDTWDFLTFDTIPEGEPLAGHLVLTW